MYYRPFERINLRSVESIQLTYDQHRYCIQQLFLFGLIFTSYSMTTIANLCLLKGVVIHGFGCVFIFKRWFRACFVGIFYGRVFYFESPLTVIFSNVDKNQATLRVALVIT